MLKRMLRDNCLHDSSWSSDHLEVTLLRIVELKVVLQPMWFFSNFPKYGFYKISLKDLLKDFL